jgi:hypothetical protein
MQPLPSLGNRLQRPFSCRCQLIRVGNFGKQVIDRRNEFLQQQPRSSKIALSRSRPSAKTFSYAGKRAILILHSFHSLSIEVCPPPPTTHHSLRKSETSNANIWVNLNDRVDDLFIIAKGRRSVNSHCMLSLEYQVNGFSELIRFQYVFPPGGTRAHQSRENTIFRSEPAP